MLHRAAFIVATLLCASTATFGLETEGMVLYATEEGDASKLIVKYLSTGQTVTIQDGRVLSACFSPDGRKVAYLHNPDPDEWNQRRKELYTMDIDGANRVKTMTSRGFTAGGMPQWCTDGYIYFTHGMPTVQRVPETGGPSEVAYTAHEGTVTPVGGTLSPNIGGDFQMSLDGTRGTGTVQQYTADGTKSGFAQMAVRLDLQEQYSIIRPCQSGMSPSGTRMSVSAMGHRIYRIYAWDLPYVDYGDGNSTYEGCLNGDYKDIMKCPEELDVMLFGLELRDMFNLGASWDATVEIGSPHWSNTDEDIFMFKDSNHGTGGWLYRISTREYTNVCGDGHRVWDYFATEIHPTTAFTLAPRSATIDYSPGEPAPAPTVTTLTSLAAMTDVTVSGAPGWLDVSVSLTSSTTCEITNTLNTGSLPAEGTYTDTMTVVPAGTTDTLTYAITLRLGPAIVPPIVILTPTSSSSFAVGDTLRVIFNADTTQAPGTVVSLSLNEGEDYVKLHTGENWGSGDSVVLAWAIPDSVNVGGTMTSTVSSGCLVRVSKYPTGLESYSETFEIVQSTAVALRRRHQRGSNLRASVHRTSQGPTLNVSSPVCAVARLLDMRGRTVARYDIAPGTSVLTVPRVEAGRYILDVSPAGGAGHLRLTESFWLD